MNSELAKLQDWFAANKLTVNVTKSNFFVFHPSHMKQKPGQKLQVNIKLTDCKNSKFIYLQFNRRTITMSNTLVCYWTINLLGNPTLTI